MTASSSGAIGNDERKSIIEQQSRPRSQTTLNTSCPLQLDIVIETIATFAGCE